MYVDPYGKGLHVRIAYEFSVGTDGPYTGESCCPTSFGGTDVMDVNGKFNIGGSIAVRYKRTDPSVNKVDPSYWKDLEHSFDPVNICHPERSEFIRAANELTESKDLLFAGAGRGASSDSCPGRMW